MLTFNSQKLGHMLVVLTMIWRTGYPKFSNVDCTEYNMWQFLSDCLCAKSALHLHYVLTEILVPLPILRTCSIAQIHARGTYIDLENKVFQILKFEYQWIVCMSLMPAMPTRWTHPYKYDDFSFVKQLEIGTEVESLITHMYLLLTLGLSSRLPQVPWVQLSIPNTINLKLMESVALNGGFE